MEPTGSTSTPALDNPCSHCLQVFLNFGPLMPVSSSTRLGSPEPSSPAEAALIALAKTLVSLTCSDHRRASEYRASRKASSARTTIAHRGTTSASVLASLAIETPAAAASVQDAAECRSSIGIVGIECHSHVASLDSGWVLSFASRAAISASCDRSEAVRATTATGNTPKYYKAKGPSRQRGP